MADVPENEIKKNGAPKHAVKKEGRAL